MQWSWESCVGSLCTLVLMVTVSGQAPGAHGLCRDHVQHPTWFRGGAVRDLLTPWGAWSTDCAALQEVHFPFFSYQAPFDFLCIFCCFLSTVLEFSKGWFRIVGEKRTVRQKKYSLNRVFLSLLWSLLQDIYAWVKKPLCGKCSFSTLKPQLRMRWESRRRWEVCGKIISTFSKIKLEWGNIGHINTFMLSE